VPLFSLAGAAVCFYLISGLEPATWIRYGVWFVVGVLVYAFYGFHKSRLKPGR
jgi:APA family basic amino acid/polyamine antiporter